jgi:site-specific DNA-methyltransferase (adenine-specific)
MLPQVGLFLLEVAMTLRIDPDFKAQIPRLSDQERAALKESILREGCRDKLVAWMAGNGEDDILLDGHHRFEICLANEIPYEYLTLEFSDREAAADWIDANQIARRNLTPGQVELIIGRRYEREKKAASGRADRDLSGDQTDHPKTADRLAVEYGVSAPTVRRHGKAYEEAKARGLDGKIQDGELTFRDMKRQAKAEANRVALELARTEIDDARRSEIASVCDLRVCSCAELFASGIKPDAVITDPPYPREFLPVFSELALGCASVGVPLVAVMSGQSYLPEVLGRLCEHLSYRWTLAYLTPGGQAVQQWETKVNASWKPVLLFGESTEWLGDVCSSRVNDNDKRFHGWGQSESGMADLIERLTEPGQLVCDPFLGGGTTAVVCLSLGRRFVGCDTDPKAVETTLLRVETMPCEK